MQVCINKDLHIYIYICRKIDRKIDRFMIQICYFLTPTYTLLCNMMSQQSWFEVSRISCWILALPGRSSEAEKEPVKVQYDMIGGLNSFGMSEMDEHGVYAPTKHFHWEIDGNPLHVGFPIFRQTYLKLDLAVCPHCQSMGNSWTMRMNYHYWIRIVNWGEGM